MDEQLPLEVTPVTPRVVSAVLTSVNSGQILGGGDKSALAKLLEQVMSEAVTQALADGVSIENSEEILKRKFAAKDRAMALYEDAMACLAERQKQGDI